VRRIGRALFHARYLLLAAWTAPFWLASTDHRAHGLSDWEGFEYGARTLIHFNSHYDTGALSLYAHFPFLQLGPPPLLAIASLQWLPPLDVPNIITAAMCLMALGCVFAIERAAVACYGDSLAARATLLIGAVIVLPAWAWESAQWRHLEDAIAVTSIIWATSLVVRGRHWWLAGALVGLGVASKPWVLPAAVVLAAFPRRERSLAAMAAIGTCAVFWAPFLLAAPGTLHALGSVQLGVSPASDLRFLGVPIGPPAPIWVRPAQLVGGFLICLLLIRARRVAAVPLVAFGIRVILDPQAWPYYGIGPLLAATWYDSTRPGRVPTWTLLTLCVEFGLPELGALPAAIGRLAWIAALVGQIWLERRRAAGSSAVPSPGAPVDEVAPALS
jgi:hypothetical protein